MRACYDLAFCPPTYDVGAFLLQLELERCRRGADKVEINILPGPVGGFRQDATWPKSIEVRRQLLHNIVVPMCEMMPGATVVVRADRPTDLVGEFGYGQYIVGNAPFFSAYALGIRPLRLPEEPVKNPRLITMTLRECEHWPERNSRVGEWQAAAHILRHNGFEVVIVRDTRTAHEPLGDLQTAPDASIDLNRRGALYNSAAFNMLVNNGVVVFALALDVPVVFMRPTTDGGNAASTDVGFAAAGVRRGHQISGAPPHQRIVWEEDFADHIVKAARDFMADAQRA